MRKKKLEENTKQKRSHAEANNSRGTTKAVTTIPVSTAIAVIGLGGFFPGSFDIRGFWRDIMAGKDMIRQVPPTHWLINDFYDPDPLAPDKTYSKRGAFLSAVDFDPMEFSIPPTSLPCIDSSQLLGLVVAKQVLQDAEQDRFGQVDRDRVGIVLGVAAGLELLVEMSGRLHRPVWVKSMREHGLPENEVQKICERIIAHFPLWKESTFPGLLGNVVSGRIAKHFDLGGINCTSDAACASGFSAMDHAINELLLGRVDLMITGGVDTVNGPFLYNCFAKTPALSPTDDIRPFSEDADGMMLGEGIGMVALKRLADAERDGDRMYAIIKGMGASSDGSGTSVYAPLAEGQAEALRRTYDMAGYSPATVELVEAHGTGTKTGDLAEFKGLKSVFEASGRAEHQWCALGSVKSQIGHTKSAAAIAGLIKAVLALHHKVLPPTIKIKRPEPEMNFPESPFYLNTEIRPWIRDSQFPRRAGISSFGFGGTNFHVTVEEYTGPGNRACRLRSVPEELVLLCADDKGALEQMCRRTADGLGFKDEQLLTYIARKSQEEFRFDAEVRLAMVASDQEDLKSKLEYVANALSQDPDTFFSTPNGIYYENSSGRTSPGGIAFLFPGQGSQYLNMSGDLAMHFDTVRQVWDLAADIVNDGPDRLHHVVFPISVFSDEELKYQIHRLTQTRWAQPAISAASLAMLTILESLGLTPDCVAGHSLGEVTAMYAAGVLNIIDVLNVARKRGELMAHASSTPGTMSAIREPKEKIEALLKEWKTDVVIANHNAPAQVVLSGPTTAIEGVEQRLSKEGIRTTRLNVSTAFHSSLMKNACEPFLEYLDDISFNKPSTPIYSNTEAEPFPNDCDEIRRILTHQLVSPVRFVEELEAIYQKGIRIFIEVGPGNTLSRLVNRCFKNRPHVAISLDSKGKHGISGLWRALAQLSVKGIKMDLSELWKHFPPLNDPRERKKPIMTVPISGANYGRLYPPKEGEKALPKPNSLQERQSPNLSPTAAIASTKTLPTE